MVKLSELIPAPIMLLVFLAGFFIALIFLYQILMPFYQGFQTLIPANTISLPNNLNMIFSIFDYGIFIILLVIGGAYLFESWNNPSKLKAGIAFLAMLILGYINAWTNHVLNFFIPFYQGQTPLFFSMISSGYFPFVLYFILVLAVIFNARDKPITLGVVQYGYNK